MCESRVKNRYFIAMITKRLYLGFVFFMPLPLVEPARQSGLAAPGKKRNVPFPVEWSAFGTVFSCTDLFIIVCSIYKYGEILVDTSIPNRCLMPV